MTYLDDVEQDEDLQDMHRLRAKRYADALADAAAADERVNELKEKLSEAEYFRRIAEDAAYVVDYLDELDTHVYKVGDAEPGDEIEYAFSLVNGNIFRSVRYGDERPRVGWHRVDAESNSYGDWSYVLESSPLVCLTRSQSAAGLDALTRKIRAMIDTEARLRRRLPPHPTYGATLDDQLTVLETKHAEEVSKMFAQTQEVNQSRTDAIFYANRLRDAVRSFVATAFTDGDIPTQLTGDATVLTTAADAWDEHLTAQRLKEGH